MKRPSFNALSVPLALAAPVAVIVVILWGTGLLASLQKLFLLSTHATGAAPRPLGALLVAPLILVACAGAASAVAIFGGRRAFPFIAGGVVLLCLLSLLLSRLAGIDMAFLPIALVALGGAIVVQAYRLWQLDGKLSDYVRHVVQQVYGEAAHEVKDVGGLTLALKLLETVLPLNEAVVLRAGDHGVLDLAARVQSSPVASAAEAGRNSAWREGVLLCEQALETNHMFVVGGPHASSSALAPSAPIDALGAGSVPLAAAAEGVSVAMPLLHEGQKVGALLVRFKDGFDDQERPLLTAVGAQLALALHRAKTRSNAGLLDLPALVSTKSAEKRLTSLGAVGELLRQEQMSVSLFEEMPDAHAVAYLDGSIVFANSHMLRAAELREDEMRSLDLFGLLDRFRGGVFDEPLIAVRRVLQSGDPYEREIFFAARDQTIQLRIALITNQPAGGAEANAPSQPLCFLVSASDVTRQKEFVSLKSDMVSLMSHELRTPITSINGFAELLVIDETLSEESREFLQIIRNESQRLSRMIDAFLAVSKLEAGDRQTISKVPLLINDVVDEMITSFQPIAKRKRIRLMPHTIPSLPPVAADRGLITQVISNLLDNAIKYSPERTVVTLTTALEADAVKVAVEDRGYGIPPESADRVWEKFYRVERNGHEHDEQSTGLGLSFVREVIEQHGGQVALESEVNRGSVFSFTLPRM